MCYRPQDCGAHYLFHDGKVESDAGELRGIPWATVIDASLRGTSIGTHSYRRLPFPEVYPRLLIHLLENLFQDGNYPLIARGYPIGL